MGQAGCDEALAVRRMRGAGGKVNLFAARFLDARGEAPRAPD